MDKPDPVSRVTPPRIIMPKIIAQQLSSQMAMAFWSEALMVVDELSKSVS